MLVLPKINIANLPTPIEPLPRLSAFLGGPMLMIKRDDLTGLAFGGNKTRKLEYLIAEAQATGARTLITAGAIQSNHCRQTAAAAARYGFDCILVLAGDKPLREDSQGAAKKTGNRLLLSGNYLLDELLGAEIVWSQPSERDVTLQSTFQTAWESGRRPYLIPYGGSNAKGAAAFAYAVKELLEQCLGKPLDGRSPDWIVFPSSSGGTQAGLIVGKRLFGFRGQILGISIDENELVLKNRVADLSNQITSHIQEDIRLTPQDVLVNAEYLGGGYGVMGEPEREAIKLFARQEGILLDPVYTGRAAAGLIDLIRRGHFHRNETILFWHTGGTPALFADRYQNLIV